MVDVFELPSGADVSISYGVHDAHGVFFSYVETGCLFGGDNFAYLHGGKYSALLLVFLAECFVPLVEVEGADCLYFVHRMGVGL